MFDQMEEMLVDNIGVIFGCFGYRDIYNICK